MLRMRIAVLITITTALLLAGAAVTISAHEPSNDLSGAVRQCLESHDPASDYCANALTLSGLSSADFWPMIAFKLFDGATFEAPKPQPDLFTLMKACFVSHDAASEDCARAQDATGLSSDDFWAKMQAKFGVTFCGQAQMSNHPENDQPQQCWPPLAELEPAQTTAISGLDGLVKDCFAKYRAAASRRGPSAMANAAAEACGKAIRESGLAPRDFFARYGSLK